MKRIVVGCFVAAAGMLIGTGAASAGQPAVQGCVGASVSANARALQPYGRNFVSTITPRNDFGSLGDAVQIVQAGGLPDELYANTCND
jgi:hypothetical protein